MFIMIAAWRQLSLFLSVEERMGRTFSEAAVSITITNLTTVLAFIIGASSPLPGVRTFCIYAGIAMFFVYFYQMTFFGASMALVGQREANNLHCYTCKKVTSRNLILKNWHSGCEKLLSKILFRVAFYLIFIGLKFGVLNRFIVDKRTKTRIALLPGWLIP